MGLSQAGCYMATFEEDDVPEEGEYFEIKRPKQPRRPILTHAQRLSRQLGEVSTGDGEKGVLVPNSSELYFVRVRRAKAVLNDLTRIAYKSGGTRYDVSSILELEKALNEASCEIGRCKVLGGPTGIAAAEEKLQLLIVQAYNKTLPLKSQSK